MQNTLTGGVVLQTQSTCGSFLAWVLSREEFTLPLLTRAKAGIAEFPAKTSCCQQKLRHHSSISRERSLSKNSNEQHFWFIYTFSHFAYFPLAFLSFVIKETA